MKCVLINGSPHKGNTFKLGEIVMQHMRNTGDVVFEEIHLGQHDLPFCKGCFCCFEQGEKKCPHWEAVNVIAKAIEAADALIVISPSYSIAPTALLKNLIDHLSYYFHRPRFFTKKAMVITTTAGAGAKATARYIRNVLGHWGFNRVHRFAAAVHAARGYSPDAKTEAKLKRAAERFYRDAAGPVRPPKLKRVAFYNIWRALAAAAPDTYDGQFWRQNGLIGTLFAPKVPLGPLASITAVILYGMVKASLKKA